MKSVKQLGNELETIDKYERRKVESRERIKVAALSLFSEQGIEATSVASIIRSAGIAHKTFFNHYPTKNHLLQSIAEEVTQVAYTIFDEAHQEQLEPYETLNYAFIKIAKGMANFTRGQKELVKYCLIGLPEGPDDLKAQQAILFREAIAKILDEAKTKNQLNPDFSYQVLLDITLGIYTSTLTNWAMQDEFPLVPKVRQAVKFIQHSVFNIEPNNT